MSELTLRSSIGINSVSLYTVQLFDFIFIITGHSIGSLLRQCNSRSLTHSLTHSLSPIHSLTHSLTFLPSVDFVVVRWFLVGGCLRCHCSSFVRSLFFVVRPSFVVCVRCLLFVVRRCSLALWTLEWWSGWWSGSGGLY